MKKAILVLVVLAISIPFAYFLLRPPDTSNQLPIAHEGKKIGSFAFQNQYGDTITLDSIDGKIMIGEYFFTTCPTICPIMNDQMQIVQKALEKRSDVVIMSFTVDPETDTVEQLFNYAQDHGAIRGKWHFLTGKKENLYNFARGSLFILNPEEAKNQADDGHDFIHTNNFVLVDKQHRIRGYYDGTNARQVQKLIRDIEKLQ